MKDIRDTKCPGKYLWCQTDCALRDHDNKQCSILTIAKSLEKISKKGIKTQEAT